MKVSTGKYEAGKLEAVWYLDFTWSWRTISLTWVWGRWGSEDFGYISDWYDGPHKSLGLGPFCIYWNW